MFTHSQSPIAFRFVGSLLPREDSGDFFFTCQSIVLCLVFYNCAKTIVPAIESVLKQTRIDLIEEILVINDGSTDDTEAVLQRFLKQSHAVPIRFFSQTNHGVSATRNFGIRRAVAPWIALLDADDMWRPEKIERQYEAILSEPKIKLLGTKYPLKILLRKKTGLVKISTVDMCLRSIFIPTSVVFDKECALKLKLFNESLQYSKDLNFFLKFLTLDGCYVPAEDLVRNDCWKAFSGETGLSSHLKEMNKGRNDSLKEICSMGLISVPFLRFLLVFNEFKYWRKNASAFLVECSNQGNVL